MQQYKKFVTFWIMTYPHHIRVSVGTIEYHQLYKDFNQNENLTEKHFQKPHRETLFRKPHREILFQMKTSQCSFKWKTSQRNTQNLRILALLSVWAPWASSSVRVHWSNEKSYRKAPFQILSLRYLLGNWSQLLSHSQITNINNS